MWKIENNFVVRLGGNTYINTPNLIAYRDQPIFRLFRSQEDGILGIDFDIYDKAKNKIATVRKGIVVSGNTSNYLITPGHSEYRVLDRSDGREIAGIQRRGVEGAELEVNAELYLPNGELLRATPAGTNLKGWMASGNVFENCGAGIQIN